MGIGYFSYIFDQNGFSNELLPLMPHLENGNYQPLFLLAKEILEANPELWDTLFELTLGYSFEEEEEGGLDPRSLVIKVMVKYLEKINIEDRQAWRMMKPALLLIGWKEAEINLLLHGKSLCSIVYPKGVVHLSNDNNFGNLANLDWCNGYLLGWLDYESITMFFQRLEQSRTDFYFLAKNPDERLQKKFNYVHNASSEWLTKRLLDSYEYTLQVFSIAADREKSLALAIA